MPKNKVTIVSISYNHEKYIAKTLESFVAQRTNFPFEVIISDDSSSDKTQSIIKKYADKYPGLIKPVYRKQNIGALNNFIDTLSMAKSEYVIYCEGDDYFTDNLKLQKQSDFLDLHKDYALCFHPVNVIFEDNPEENHIFPPVNYQKKFTIDSLLKDNFIQTNSCMYRWIFNKTGIKNIFPSDILPGDYFLHLLHAETGKIGFINENMSVYRRHINGIWFLSGKTKYKFWINNGTKHINFYNSVEKHFAQKYKINFILKKLECAVGVFEAVLATHNFQKFKEMLKLYPFLTVSLIYYIPYHYTVKIIKKLKKSLR